MRQLAQNRLKQLFQALCARHRTCLPDRFRQRVGALSDLERSVGDYLAGMTDRFCEQQSEQHRCPEGRGVARLRGAVVEYGPANSD